MASDLPPGPDPTLYLYTSLTAGSSHIITATSRLETILKANKIAFRAIDCATDEKARSLWGRRSKGRKIPGLVKYGQVIGDLTEVEEWNEYGEIRENIDNVSDLFGDTPMTDTPMPPPAPITLQNPLAKITEPVPRSSSETRHISISDPKDKDGSSQTSSARTSKDETPLSAALRQAGTEAAAKANLRKASTPSSSSTASIANPISLSGDNTDTVPSPSALKMSKAVEEPAEATEITAAKTPAQLASEGARKTSVEKIASTAADEKPSSTSTESESLSNEEQLLEARRSSSITKVPSRLAQETSIDAVDSLEPEGTVANDPADSDSANPGFHTQHHLGRNLRRASIEEIKAVEQETAIKEHSGEDGEDTEVKDSLAQHAVQATDEGEAAVMEGTKPQDQEAKDADAAGMSVGD